jgi:four helix bundle protein
MSDYRTLKVWQRSHELTLEVYRATAPFPRSEQYGLTSQLRRAASSVPANIAEGVGRGTRPELARFCRFALGSLNELEYHILLAGELGYLERSGCSKLATDVIQIRRMLTKFVRNLRPSSN